jgi:hypothetical protein
MFRHLYCGHHQVSYMNNLKVSYLCINYELMLREGGGGDGDGHALCVIAYVLGVYSKA